MSIDWITVAAQLVNFLVLVWLLKRFLYRPILDGIDARESEIAEKMGEAARIRENAESTKADYQQQLVSLQQDRTTALEQARQEAQTERDTLLGQTRERIRQEQAAARQQQQRQARDYIDELHQMSATAILDVVNKALADLSDETLEERLVLHALSSMKQQRASADAPSDEPPAELILTTRNCLSEPARQRIRTSTDALWPGCKLRFEEDEQQSPGARVQFGSSQLEWTVDTYVKALEAQLPTTLTSDTHSSSPGAGDPPVPPQEQGSAHEDRQP